MSFEKLPKRNFKEKISNNLFIQFDEFIESNTSKETLVFDTNFLFVPFEFRVEIIGEIQKLLGNSVSFVIVEETLQELEQVEKKGDKNKKFLPLIATFLNRYNVQILTQINTNQTSHVDDTLCTLPKDFTIATNDKELRHRLWEIPKRVIFMRQKSYLDIK